jgi:hypothetical protein
VSGQRHPIVGYAPGEVIRCLGGIAAVLIGMHFLLQGIEHFGGGVHYLLLDLFNVDVEDSFPTWYSAALLLACAGLLADLARHPSRDRFRRHWRALAIVFLALSADEIAGVHETLNTVLPFPWTLPAAIALVVFGLAYTGFLRAQDPRTRRAFLIAAAIYVGGAVGIEQALGWFGGSTHQESFAFALWSGAEESAELLGVLVFLYHLLRLGSRESQQIP